MQRGSYREDDGEKNLEHRFFFLSDAIATGGHKLVLNDSFLFWFYLIYEVYVALV